MYPTLAVNLPDGRQRCLFLYFRLHRRYIQHFQNIKTKLLRSH